MKSQWSARDQEQLDALQKRKAAFMSEARKPLDTIVKHLDLRVGVVNPLSLASNKPYPAHVSDLLMQHADDLRDALAPFDSGVRSGGGE